MIEVDNNYQLCFNYVIYIVHIKLLTFVQYDMKV